MRYLLAVVFVGAVAACSAPPTGDSYGTSAQALSITKVEVNQALGVQYNGAQKFVAGKPTAIVVQLDGPVDADALLHKLVVKRAGNVVATLEPTPSTGQPYVAFQCPSIDACGNWVEGNYTFEAAIGDLTASTTATFVKRATLRVLAVPIKVKYGAVVKEIPESDHRWKKTVEFVRAVFPVAPTDLQWTVRDTLDLSAIDISTEDGQRAVWQALTDLNPASCAANPADPECFQIISGFIKEVIGTTQGYTFGLPAVVSVNDDQDVAATVTHEMSHPYGIGDEYQGGQFNCSVNPVPASYTGKNFSPPNEQANYRCAASTEESAETIQSGTGTVVRAAQWHPFDTTGRGVLGDMAGYMGSGGKQEKYWVTPRIYDRLFDAFAPVAAVATSAIVPVVGLEGFVRKAGAGFTFEVQPLYTFDGQDPVRPATKGEWYAQALSASGAELAFANAPVSFFAPFEPPQVLQEASFRASMALPAGTAKIVFKHNDDILKELAVSATKPVVTIGGITAGQTAAGTVHVTWTMTDSDGGSDLLRATLEYSADSGTRWEVIADDLDGNEIDVDMNDYPGGGADKSLFRIVVTDGVQTTVATTPAFTVAIQKPEVYIDEPETGATFVQGTDVVFEGVAFDEFDGDLVSATELVWSSDKDGKLGGGETVQSTKLTAGTHVISLTGTNSLGEKTVVTTSVTITAKATPDAGTPATAPGGGGDDGCSYGARQPNHSNTSMGFAALVIAGLAGARRRRERR